MWRDGGDCGARRPKHAFWGGTLFAVANLPGGVSAADRLRSEVPGGPAAGHETQTRTISFHGCVASPVGCAGLAVAAGGFDRGRSGVVNVVFWPALKHYQTGNTLGGYKENGREPVRFMQLIYTCFQTLSSEIPPKR